MGSSARWTRLSAVTGGAMYEANCPHCNAFQQTDSTSLAVKCVRCGKQFNPKYPEGAPVKGFTKYDVAPSAAPGAPAPARAAWTPRRKLALVLLPVFIAMFVISGYRFWSALPESEPDGPTGWHRHRDDTAGFTAWFPGPPETNSAESAGLGLSSSMIHEAVWAGDGVTVEVVWSKVSVIADVDLQKFLDMAMILLGAELIDSKETEHQGVPAMWAAGMAEEGEITVKVFETNHKLFILAITGPGDDWNKFSESFYLDPDQRTGAETFEFE